MDTYIPNDHSKDYAIELPIAETLTAMGFEDNSWHNDINPSFEKATTFHGRPDGEIVRIYISPINQDLWESDTKFTVIKYDHEMVALGDGFDTDNFNEALDVIREALEANEAA